MKANLLKANLKYLLVGIFLGIVFVKSEIISWYRIQEMFRLKAFHMYGVIGMAVTIGILSVFIIKKIKLKDINGTQINVDPKKFDQGQIYGGLIFGAGWALTGACPGPIFALIGSGNTIFILTLTGALLGVWIYGIVENKLPH